MSGAAFLALAALVFPAPAAHACSFGDFACEAFAKPDPAKKTRVSTSKPGNECPETQGDYLRRVFRDFERLSDDWKRVTCRILYPNAVREGAIDFKATNEFLAKCMAFEAQGVDPKNAD